jgi:hypothetical protein
MRSGNELRITVPREWIRAEYMENEKTVDAVEEGGILMLLPKRQIKDDELDHTLETIRMMIQATYRSRAMRQ